MSTVLVTRPSIVPSEDRFDKTRQNYEKLCDDCPSLAYDENQNNDANQR